MKEPETFSEAIENLNKAVAELKLEILKSIQALVNTIFGKKK